MPTELTVSLLDQEGDQAIVAASGEIDMDTTGKLEHLLDELIASGARRLVVDISGVGFCDSTGLATFVRAREHVREHPEGTLALVGMTSGVRKVFGITGLTELFECYDTLADARLTLTADDRAME